MIYNYDLLVSSVGIQCMNHSLYIIVHDTLHYYYIHLNWHLKHRSLHQRVQARLCICMYIAYANCVGHILYKNKRTYL